MPEVDPRHPGGGPGRVGCPSGGAAPPHNVLPPPLPRGTCVWLDTTPYSHLIDDSASR